MSLLHVGLVLCGSIQMCKAISLPSKWQHGPGCNPTEEFSWCPGNLQHILLLLQGYDFNIQYKWGWVMVLADTVSCLNPIPGEKIKLDLTSDNTKIGPDRKTALWDDTQCNSVLSGLICHITEGCPSDTENTPKATVKGWEIPYHPNCKRWCLSDSPSWVPNSPWIYSCLAYHHLKMSASCLQ